MTTLVIISRKLDGGSIEYISKEDSDKVLYNRFINKTSFKEMMKEVEQLTKYWYDGRPDSPTFGELFLNHPNSSNAILLDKNLYDFII